MLEWGSRGGSPHSVGWWGLGQEPPPLGRANAIATGWNLTWGCVLEFSQVTWKLVPGTKCLKVAMMQCVACESGDTGNEKSRAQKKRVEIASAKFLLKERQGSRSHVETGFETPAVRLCCSGGFLLRRITSRTSSGRSALCSIVDDVRVFDLIIVVSGAQGVFFVLHHGSARTHICAA